jgi:hypothetical protein
LAHGEVEDENGGGHIEDYAIEGVLLADFEQQVFFKEGPYVFDAIDGVVVLAGKNREIGEAKESLKFGQFLYVGGGQSTL